MNTNPVEASEKKTSKPPLLVQVIYHPKSESARKLARHIHQQLNDDIVVPGLRVPTIFCPFDRAFQPPADYRLDHAERTFVIPLADDQLTIDEEWCRFVADVWKKCQQGGPRCMPVQLSPSAWPLDERFNLTNFVRAVDEKDEERRNALVVRRTVVELCRYFSNLQLGGSDAPAPTKLFLSHAKIDLKIEPPVTQKFIDALNARQPIKTWFDSGDIPSGSTFSDEIEKGICESSVLVILTDNYATREWCREEVLLAKEHQRPIAVVDALSKYEVRSFPYLGNVPRIRWDNNPQSGIDLMLKETLRHLHTTAILNRSRNPGEVIFERAPELATLVGLEPNTQVLYPDPPVGVGEARRLAKTKVSFMTPLQRSACDRSLKGKRIAISVSESTDIAPCGMDPLQLDGCTMDLARYLLIRGATLAYGGHVGEEGYTVKLYEVVRTHNDLKSVEAFERIVNFRGWPLPRHTIQKLAELNRDVKTMELPRPYDIDESLHEDFKAAPSFFAAEKSPQHRFAWARGMTEMRAYQADKSQSGVVARIVVGGTFAPTVKVLETGERKEVWYSSRIPGVLEEVLLSVQKNQPVFLIGAFGGVARLVIDLLLGMDREEATWEYQKKAPFAVEMKELYEQRSVKWVDYPEIIDLLRQKGIRGINPLLTEEEHRELFETVDPTRMVELVLRGLNNEQS